MKLIDTQGSIQQTSEDARNIDKTNVLLITTYNMEENDIMRKTQSKGYSSNVASEPHFEHQVDPFCVNLGEQKLKYDLLAVEVVPMLKNKRFIFIIFL